MGNKPCSFLFLFPFDISFPLVRRARSVRNACAKMLTQRLKILEPADLGRKAPPGAFQDIEPETPRPDPGPNFSMYRDCTRQRRSTRPPREIHVRTVTGLFLPDSSAIILPLVLCFDWSPHPFFLLLLPAYHYGLPTTPGIALPPPPYTHTHTHTRTPLASLPYPPTTTWKKRPAAASAIEPTSHVSLDGVD